MIKVPGTIEGVPAVRQLTDEGINVNITLLFSRTAYKAVAEAYLAGPLRATGADSDRHHLLTHSTNCSGMRSSTIATRRTR